jgi:hypothetical protein
MSWEGPQRGDLSGGQEGQTWFRSCWGPDGGAAYYLNPRTVSPGGAGLDLGAPPAMAPDGAQSCLQSGVTLPCK